MLRGINGSGGGVPISGSGAQGYVAKWTAATTLGGSTTSGADASPYIGTDGRMVFGGTTLSSVASVSAQTIGTSSSYYGAWKTSATAGGSVFGCGTNPFEIYTSTGTLGSETYTLRTYIDTSGNFLLNPATANVVFSASASGQGIKLFTAPANTDGQTLDCYLDGGLTAGGVSWTPTVGGTAAAWGGVLPVVASAKYSRIGNLVFCSVSLTGAALVTSYGNNTITGPFAAGPTVNTSVPTSGGSSNGVGVQAGNTIYLPTIAGATAEIRLNWFYAV